MKTAGIIAEFDPFHNGHKYLITTLRDRGFTHIACAMSGSATQRGSLAVYDKYFRAETAVKNGADLVLEIPAPYSCSNAEVFASAGVRALSALGEGVIGTLAFGSEIDDAELIKRASAAADELKSSQKVKELLSSGKSYPAAVYEACKTEYGIETASVFETPNSTLAVEYCRAVRRSAPLMTPLAVKRVSAGHNTDEISNGIASASLIRKMLTEGKDISCLVPAVGEDPCDLRKIDNIFLYSLLTADKKRLLSLPDTDEALADRIIKASKGRFNSSASLLEACKTRNYTAARLRRLALHLVLGVGKDDIRPLPYCRVLALNERGRELLGAGEHMLSVGTSLKKLESSSAFAGRISALEGRASVLRAMGTSDRIPDNDYSKQIKLLNNIDNE